MDNDFATGYALGADSNGNGNNGCNGGMWGYGWWAIIIFAMIFGWGNGGWGGFGGGGNGAQGAITRSDLCSEFAFNDLQRAVAGVNTGLCDGFYAMNTSLLNGFNGTNTAMLQGFNGIQSGMTQLGYQMQDCCCNVRSDIKDLSYQNAKNTCDIIQSAHNDTDRIINFLTQDKIASLQAENQTLKFAASQANQNAVLQAAMTANTAEIIRRTGNDCPIPEYVVPNPNCCYGNPNGVGYGNCGSGCC